MSKLENIIRFESASSGVAFRKSLYGPGEEATAVADCIALANAELESRRRYLFLGIDDMPGGGRKLAGVDRAGLAAMKRRFMALIARAIEPALVVDVRGIEIDGRLLGVVRIKDCTKAPYLTRTAIGEKLPAGVGFIRRGARNMPLTRADMQRMFTREPAAPLRPVPLVLGFPGVRISERIGLPVLGLRKLPSQLAAERLKALLAARDKAKEAFGRTETQFHRLMHARFYGPDTPFEAHTDESLMIALQSVAVDNAAADAHYLYEVRAHKLGLVAANRGEVDYHDVVLSLSMRVIAGTGIADRIYPETAQVAATDGYPAVTANGNRIVVAAELGTLSAGRQVNAFREPPRFWAREEAASKTVTLDYTLTADELDEPLRGSLFIDIEPESLRSV